MEGWISFFLGKTLEVGIHLFYGLIKAWPSGHSFAEETLLDPGLAEAFRSIDRVAPKDTNHVIGLESGLDILGISLSGGH